MCAHVSRNNYQHQQSCLVIVPCGAQRFVEAGLGQTAVRFAACIVKCLSEATNCLVIALCGVQIFVEAWLGQAIVICIEGNLKPFARFRVALRSVEACLE